MWDFLESTFEAATEEYGFAVAILFLGTITLLVVLYRLWERMVKNIQQGKQEEIARLERIIRLLIESKKN